MTSGGIRMEMAPPHPDAFIRIEALEELGLSVSTTDRILGVRRATLSNLLNGNASLSPEMALRIEKAFGPGMDLLLRMQAWHDATRVRARAGVIGAERDDGSVRARRSDKRRNADASNNGRTARNDSIGMRARSRRQPTVSERQPGTRLRTVGPFHPTCPN